MIIDDAQIKRARVLGLEIFGAGRSTADDFSFERGSGFKFASIDQKVSLGAYSYVVSGYLCGVSIGRYCSFGESVQIGRQSHPIDWVSTSPFGYLHSKKVADVNYEGHAFHGDFCHTEAPTKLKQITIGHDVWIGHAAMVLPGLTIGNGAIIAAGAVVTKDVEPYSIVGGNPARHIRYRVKEEYIPALQALNWWDYHPVDIGKYDLNDVPLFLESFAADSAGFKKNKEQYTSLKDVLSEKEALSE